MDVHTRMLRSFVVLADELHFTRAAGRLYITQQALSNQMKRLEDAVGVALLQRSTRRVELTEAGARLLESAVIALDALDRSLAEIRAQLVVTSGALAVGFLAFAALELTNPIVKEFRRCAPGVRLGLHEFGYSDVTCGLAGGTSDVAFLRSPVSAAGLQHERLFCEPRVVALPSDHELASRMTVGVEEVLDLPILAPNTQDRQWVSFWMLEDHRAGAQAPIAIHDTATIVEELETVAAGLGCMITAGALRRYMPHPGIRFVELRNVPGSDLTVSWREDAATPAVALFVECALRVRDQQRELVAVIEATLPGDAERP